MDDTTRFILFGLAIPGVLGFVVGAVGAMGTRREAGLRSGAGESKGGRIAGHVIIGVVLAVLAGALTLSTYGVHGAAEIPPVSSDDRLRIVPVVLLLAALLLVIVRMVRSMRGAVEGTVDHILAGLMAASSVGGAAIALGRRADWGTMTGAVGLGVLASVGALALYRVQSAGGRARAGVVLMGLAAAVGAALTGTGSVKLGQYGFGAVAVATGVVLGSLLLRGSLRALSLGMLIAFVFVLLGNGIQFSETPWWVAIVLGLVAPVAWVADALISRRLRPGVGAAVTVAAAACVAIAAVAPGLKSLVDFMTGAPTSQGE